MRKRERERHPKTNLILAEPLRIGMALAAPKAARRRSLRSAIIDSNLAAQWATDKLWPWGNSERLDMLLHLVQTIPDVAGLVFYDRRETDCKLLVKSLGHSSAETRRYLS